MRGNLPGKSHSFRQRQKAPQGRCGFSPTDLVLSSFVSIIREARNQHTIALLLLESSPLDISRLAARMKSEPGCPGNTARGAEKGKAISPPSQTVFGYFSCISYLR